MALDIVGKAFDVTDAIKAHADKAVGKLSKLKVDLSYNTLALKKDGANYVSEYEVQTNLGHFFARGTDTDCYVSITDAVNKIYEQVKKKLDKLQHPTREKVELEA
ncbi:ribosomal subunit interface protein [Psittacicella hinzii]|uniref:Ribosomal subunit interface protein n=1 Tax=Psittacicella hinzii TaxID=2028575 RepID=A0A3A1Y405_9GAMM|nr:ribosome-associated translation inhibitor RaiA [Psittacicella hinzii]RIY32295.1 ribosomal subunit interface protein [Psittacicella hinzii]